MDKNKNKSKIIIFILAILLVAAVVYIGVGKYNIARQEEQLSIYQQGMQAGYEQAIIQLVQQAAACQQVPVRVENQTINLIDITCLEEESD